jgi:DNA-binding transcriptional LysR family regulator
VAPVIDRLSRQYPQMTFHVVAGVPGPLRQEVAARNLDFAISDSPACGLGGALCFPFSAPAGSPESCLA